MMSIEDPAKMPQGSASSSRNRHRSSTWRRTVLVTCTVVALLAFGFFTGGFLRFAHDVSGAGQTPANLRADAIVVLTGGSERVKQALGMLADERAARLLISGVHPDTTPEQIVQRTQSNLALFACCIDLDREAANTIENAVETGKWAQEHEFRRLIVVTSSYHMPRALLELRAVMPELDLVPAPVQAKDLALETWYHDPQVSVLLVREYLKYILARFRIATMGRAEV